LLLTASRAVQGGTGLQLATAVPTGVTAWLAPTGTTAFQAGPNMTALAGNGTVRAIVAPTAEAVYKLFLVDDAGNVSNPSAASVTVDNMAPTDQDALLPTSVNTTSGASLTLASSPAAGETVWIAPATATVFAPGSTMTSSASATIAVPTTAAQYKVFVIDAAGNISFPSTATITVQ
jgi:hypothetical protein